MINQQWETCPNCSKDKKYVMFRPKEVLVCKYNCEINKKEKESKCTCSSGFQSGLCQWCTDEWNKNGN